MTRGKSKFFGIVAPLVLCLGISLNVQARVYEHRVLRPDGKPAVAAKVHALLGTDRWALRRGGEKSRDVIVQTDAEGKFKLESQGDLEQLVAIVVDAPGCDLGIWSYSLEKSRDLKLELEQPVTGSVLRDHGIPVSDAIVVAHTFGLGTYLPFFLQDPRKPRFPELTAKIGGDGKFRLRGFTSNNHRNIPGASTALWATARINDRNWMGGSVTSKEKKPIDIEVLPNVTVRGQVVHYATGQPLEDARVEYSGGFHEEPVLTDAEGRFQFNDLPANQARRLTVSHKAFPNAYMSVSTDKQTLDEKQLQPEVVIGLRPVVPIAGKVINERSGQPLPFRVQVSAGWMQRSNGWIHTMHGASATDLETGEFKFMAPVGSVRIGVDPSAIQSIGDDILETVDRPLEVPLDGLQNMLIKTQRRPGLLVKFEKKNPADEWPHITVHKRTPEGWRVWQGARGPHWFSKAEKWGEEIELRGVGDNGKEVFPPTKIVADPGKWPIVIQLP